MTAKNDDKNEFQKQIKRRKLKNVNVTIYKLYSRRTFTIKSTENLLIHSRITVELPEWMHATIVVLTSIHSSGSRWHLRKDLAAKQIIHYNLVKETFIKKFKFAREQALIALIMLKEKINIKLFHRIKRETFLS